VDDALQYETLHYSNTQLQVSVGIYIPQVDNSDHFINIVSIRVTDWPRLTDILHG
jgi:hypothetical protein